MPELPNELAFVDAVAGEKSVVGLPYAEDHTFCENRGTAKELELRGWIVERIPPHAAWETDISVEAHAYPYLEAEVRGG